MTTLLLVLAAWIALSVILALVMGPVLHATASVRLPPRVSDRPVYGRPVPRTW